MKSLLRSLVIASFALFVGVSAQADYYYGPQLRQETAQLIAQADVLRSSVLNVPGVASDETFVLWGTALAFQQVLEREAYTLNFPVVQRALDAVAFQRGRTESALLSTPDYYRVQSILNQIGYEISQIRFFLKPAPAPTLIALQRCHVGGNFLTPDLTVEGSIRGIGLRKATLFFKGAVVGDLRAINDYYGSRPADRTIEATIPFNEKFRKGASGGTPDAPRTCRLEVIDEMNQVTVAEIPAN